MNNHAKTAYEWGRLYAKFSVKHNNYTDGPIEYEKTYPTIPDGDYIAMKNLGLGIEKNDREYWMGFN